ncbi:hypothetical protein SEA_PHRIENDS_57 [Microbacterium phage Phriends]|uniref:Uncharacterized protein n=6 Tax=Ilzatvirus teagan TaxID=2845595 RepID=A0A6B9LPX0_9CAUD|nr:hypothetical protein PBI_PEEP_58 [Microbacterium phage Peep]AUX83334.1 hypothetical protein PBI_SUPERFRESH_58 [Microbacterium phage Superfresh]QBZ72983.1 hypothetical protein SEA_PHRIENDS_57 [Microbacterium phage Phriends]QDP45013.1 hypothetical protein SEA_ALYXANDRACAM_58 [Microbacterium phage Alyxandracam]QHB47860.1 hypothetical protein SEA_RENZIE_58 [Microbacterium phage Renzie]QOI67046.1 hypothetical protein SEA_MAELINDA_58 [Microbacterium phage MaeLinda]
MATYILARTGKGRPTLQHALADDGLHTVCGLSVVFWSRAYQSKPITEIICRRCAKRLTGSA